MKDRIKELAKQAGELFSLHGGSFALFGNETIERFAELVAADEREACAKLCDAISFEEQENGSKSTGAYMTGAYMCSQAIRSRSDT